MRASPPPFSLPLPPPLPPPLPGAQQGWLFTHRNGKEQSGVPVPLLPPHPHPPPPRVGGAGRGGLWPGLQAGCDVGGPPAACGCDSPTSWAGQRERLGNHRAEARASWPSPHRVTAAGRRAHRPSGALLQSHCVDGDTEARAQRGLGLNHTPLSQPGGLGLEVAVGESSGLCRQ